MTWQYGQEPQPDIEFDIDIPQSIKIKHDFLLHPVFVGFDLLKPSGDVREVLY